MICSTLCSFVCVAPLFVSSPKQLVVGSLHISEKELIEEAADGRYSDEKCLIQLSKNSDVLLAREAVVKHDERLMAHANASQFISRRFRDKQGAHLASRIHSPASHALDGAHANQALLTAQRTITPFSEMPLVPRILCKGLLLIVGVWLCGWSVGWVMSQYQKSQTQLPMRLGAKCPPPEQQAPSESGSDLEGGKAPLHRYDPERQPDPTFCEIMFAVLIYAPGLGLVTAVLMILWTVQQILVLPFRPCGGKPLAAALNFFAPLMSSVVFVFVTGSTGESCYGRRMDRDRCKSFADFLQPCSAPRRKNIKRNLKAAEQAMQTNDFKVSYYEAGSWRITPAMRALIWDQCQHHVTRVFGWPDIMNCQQPVSPRVMYFGEMLLLLAFACDIQLVKARDGKIVSLNTRVHVGDVLFNPNYATDPAHAQDGIYAWVSHDLVNHAIQLGVDVVNLMPSMRPAKKIIGMRSLQLGSLICACWSFDSRRPRPKFPVEEKHEPKPVLSQAAITAEGGKRAKRKRAAALAATTASTEDSPVAIPKRKEQHVTSADPDHVVQAPADSASAVVHVSSGVIDAPLEQRLPSVGMENDVQTTVGAHTGDVLKPFEDAARK